MSIEYANIGTRTVYSFTPRAKNFYPLDSGNFAFRPGEHGDYQGIFPDMGAPVPGKVEATWRMDSKDGELRRYNFTVQRPDPERLARKHGFSRGDLKWCLIFAVKDDVVEYAWSVAAKRNPREIGWGEILLYGGNNINLLRNENTHCIPYDDREEILRRITPYPGQ